MNANDAKHYAFFILAHEVAHIEYCERNNMKDIGNRSSKREEEWCDNYAEKIVKAIKGSEPPNKAL